MIGFGEIAERLRRSTVQILVTEARGGSGSGLIYGSTGLIVTNAHVARSSIAEVELFDGARVRASVQKRDDRLDLALLKISRQDLQAASIADAKSLRVGELVVAVGNPLGFVGAVSTGVVHAVGPLRGLGPRLWVQSSVRLAPGNSGGPLANTRGEVVGINTMIVGHGGSHSLALAIPGAVVASFLRRAEGSPSTLGITVQPIPLPAERGLGFLILELQVGGPADRASLFQGDLLIGADGRPFTSLDDLTAAIDGTNGSSSVTLQFRRGAAPQARSVTVPLGGGKAAAA